ncbi:glycosyltransferase family protein [Streptomyces sp. NPDC002676]
MSPPVVLHINNEPVPIGTGTRFFLPFRRLAGEGLLVHRPVAPSAVRREHGVEAAFRAVRAVVGDARPDLVFVQSPHAFPWTAEAVGALLRDFGGPPVVFWEGDLWGGRKRMLDSSRAWLAHADAVFSVGMGRQAALLRGLTRAPVRYVPHALPVRFCADPGESVPRPETATDDIAVVGNCLARFGLIGGLDGSLRRARMVRGLRRITACDLAVYGTGWHGKGARGPVPYGEQVNVMRRARLTAGWDHYNSRTAYFSDRLPIALYAGRPHVTSRQPGLDWLPGPDHGLYLADTPSQAVAILRRLLRHGDHEELHTAAVRGHHWTAANLTELHALRYMLSGLLPVPAPQGGPWPDIRALSPSEPVPV